MGGPPLQKAAVYTYKQAVYTDQKSFNSNRERSLSWGPIQAQRQLTPPAQRWGQGCWLLGSQFARSAVPPSEGAVSLSLPKHPAWHSSGKPSKIFAWSNTRRSLQLCKSDSKRLCHQACNFADKRQNSRQQFLPIKPCCPDPEGLVSQVSHRQPEHSLILPPPTLKNTLIN